MVSRRIALVVSIALVACDVEPVAPTCGGDRVCPALPGEIGARGLVVVDSDYQSTNVVALAWGSEPSSIVSSRATSPGLTAAVSGDVVVPQTAPASGEIVLLDRTNGVVAWIAPSTCGVRAQLSLGSFGPDPYDYVEVGEKAYVARYVTNPKPTGDLDRGGDVAIVDRARGSLVGAIELRPYVPTTPPGALPFPARFLAWRGLVLVLLQGFTPDYAQAADATIVAIDPARDAVAWSTTIAGVADCGSLALGEGDRVAMACSGPLLLHGSSTDPLATSAVVVLAADEAGHLGEQTRLSAHDAGAKPFATPLAWVDASTLLTASYGSTDTGEPDDFLAIDVAHEPPRATRVAFAGGPFAVGSALCRGPTCIATDAGGATGPARLRSFVAVAGGLSEVEPLPFCDGFGLPPRSFGAL